MIFINCLMNVVSSNIEDKASFEHLINQCQQVGSIPIALYGGANKEILIVIMELNCRVKKEIETQK